MSETTTRKSLPSTLPAIILLTLVACGLGGGYYFAAAQSGPPTVNWSTNPLFITFSSTSGSGSAADSFTCNPSIAPVTLSASSNQPATISLSVNPSAFSTCGSNPDNVVVTAACIATAKSTGSCQGDFSGKILVCGPTPYTCQKKTLTVVITVSGTQQENNGSENAAA